jgi:hypothetical protein
MHVRHASTLRGSQVPDLLDETDALLVRGSQRHDVQGGDA